MILFYFISKNINIFNPIYQLFVDFLVKDLKGDVLNFWVIKSIELFLFKFKGVSILKLLVDFFLELLFS